MDPFEAATQLSQILRSLSSQLQYITKAAHFALRNAEHEDYLFLLILELLRDENVELGQKGIIFQFLEVLLAELCHYLSQGKYRYPYVDSVKKNMAQIVLWVVPHSSNTNLANVYTCLTNMTKLYKVDCQEYSKKFHENLLTENDLSDIAMDIPYPEVEVETVVDENPIITAWKVVVEKKKQSQYEWQRRIKHTPAVTEDVDENELFTLRPRTDTKQKDGMLKKEVLERMEADRESHKRLKELLWVVERSKEVSYLAEEEFVDYYWNKLAKLDAPQYKVLMDNLEEVNKVVARSYKDKQISENDK